MRLGDTTESEAPTLFSSLAVSCMRRAVRVPASAPAEHVRLKLAVSIPPVLGNGGDADLLGPTRWSLEGSLRSPDGLEVDGKTKPL